MLPNVSAYRVHVIISQMFALIKLDPDLECFAKAVKIKKIYKPTNIATASESMVLTKVFETPF